MDKMKAIAYPTTSNDNRGILWHIYAS